MAGLGEILEENSRLRELVREREVQLAAQAAKFAEQIAALKESNERFARHFAFLEQRRKLAAAERFVAAELQSPLFDGLKAVAPPRDPEVEKKSQDKPKTTKATHPRKGRRDVSALDLPHRKVEAPVNPSSCEQCGGDRVLVEPRVTWRVGWEPGRFTKVEVHQDRCQCPSCPNAAVWMAPEPCLLPGAMCDDGLLARVVVDKFGDHLPLNRQADRMSREGFEVNQNVLSGWVRQGIEPLRLLVTALRKQVVATETLLGDDSGLPVQDGEGGALGNGRLWAFTDQHQAFFAFSRTKQGEHPTTVLRELGVERIRLVVDGGSEYNDAVDELGLTRGGCWAHLRRYFFNASLQHDEAKAGLRTIQDLFAIERAIADRPPPERLEVRQQRSAPLVDGFFTWVKALGPSVRPGSKLGDAVGYAISQEQRMRLFLAHGDVPLHNNLSELLLRQPIVGRKNWLFSGSEGGARAAADWFSLIASCRMQRVDPWTYLHDVFGRLLDHPSTRVHELTPRNWRLAVEKGDIIPRSPGRSQ